MCCRNNKKVGIRSYLLSDLTFWVLCIVFIYLTLRNKQCWLTKTKEQCHITEGYLRRRTVEVENHCKEDEYTCICKVETSKHGSGEITGETFPDENEANDELKVYEVRDTRECWIHKDGSDTKFTWKEPPKLEHDFIFPSLKNSKNMDFIFCKLNKLQKT